MAPLPVQSLGPSSPVLSPCVHGDCSRRQDGWSIGEDHCTRALPQPLCCHSHCSPFCPNAGLQVLRDGRQEGKWSGSVDVRGRPHHGRSRWRLPRREDNEGIKPTPNALLGEKDKRRELTAKLPNAEGFRRPSPSPSAVPKPGSQAAACPKGVSEASKKGYRWIEGHLLTKSSAEDS